MSKLLANIQCEPSKLQNPTSLLCYSSLNCVNKKPKKTNIIFLSYRKLISSMRACRGQHSVRGKISPEFSPLKVLE